MSIRFTLTKLTKGSLSHRIHLHHHIHPLHHLLHNRLQLLHLHCRILLHCLHHHL
jgi:hypothetical protein